MTPNEDSDNDEYDYLLDDADRDEYSSPRDVSQVRIRGPRRVTCLRGETVTDYILPITLKIPYFCRGIRSHWRIPDTDYNLLETEAEVSDPIACQRLDDLWDHVSRRRLHVSGGEIIDCFPYHFNSVEDKDKPPAIQPVFFIRL
ncbi:hypothetical protein CAOG_08347 [Capsaspora owczarzaki ATCC 30864]|uniref:hypothetical protein n=1 Tax=Capsaspora owczarzaki (strain ATCC 30864) TaxID=595528 RepID=UPI0001FE3098|nr:hypothetical protein CAOG_08347 [Capsaspora owczarzaki ATCC 30864]|eukprot:XP_004340665.1 hypothetical protein CAOG_08347 [Capsaspora owczarzaki ATCC 30864]